MNDTMATGVVGMATSPSSSCCDHTTTCQSDASKGKIRNKRNGEREREKEEEETAQMARMLTKRPSHDGMRESSDRRWPALASPWGKKSDVPLRDRRGDYSLISDETAHRNAAPADASHQAAGQALATAAISMLAVGVGHGDRLRAGADERVLATAAHGRVEIGTGRHVDFKLMRWVKPDKAVAIKVVVVVAVVEAVGSGDANGLRCGCGCGEKVAIKSCGAGCGRLRFGRQRRRRMIESGGRSAG